jgi:hypothetical protein
MIGIGLPATIFALVKGKLQLRIWLTIANSAEIQTELPAWNGLLLVYGSLYLPVIFVMLFELNLDAWVNARINYEVCHSFKNKADDSLSWSFRDLYWISGLI